jgi:lysophospholipase L1-like esterase
MVHGVKMSRRAMLLASVLSVTLALGGGGGADAASQANWYAAWGFSQQGLAPETLSNQTIRMITRPSLSGSAVRVTLENTFGTQPVMIGAAYVGYRASTPGPTGATLVPGSNTPVTFGGATSVSIPAGGSVVSDQVSLPVQALQDLAVSLYLPGSNVPISRHTNARVTSYLTPPGSGNQAAAETNTAFTMTTTSMYFVTAVDVLSSTAAGSIIAFGDSITDGTGSTIDGYDRWHDILVLRMLLDPKAKQQFGVVNEGIGGNRIIFPPGQGPLAVLRLDRDVLARSGATHVIFFEGTNDLAGGATADQVIEGSQQIIDRVHAAGLQIIGATMIPRHNANWTPQMTEYRNIVNDWIRNKADFDAVIDFDRIIADPDDPDLMNPIYDLADHIHPNPLGYLVMGQSIDLKLFDSHGNHGGH